MADEIISELWKVKDGLSKEASKDMKAFCRRLNEEVRQSGDVLMRSPQPIEMKVAENFTEYGTGNKES